MTNRKTILLSLLFSAPIAAFAHVHLESSIPAAGSTVKSSPAQLVLVFQEAVELKALSLQKAGENATTSLPLPKEAAEQLAVPLPKLADGDYTVNYTYVGPDEHKMNSKLQFKVSAKAMGMDMGKGMGKEHMEHMEHMHQHDAKPEAKPDAGATVHDHASSTP
jgi:methionine-rich copper-binding protein CopC